MPDKITPEGIRSEPILTIIKRGYRDGDYDSLHREGWNAALSWIEEQLKKSTPEPLGKPTEENHPFTEPLENGWLRTVLNDVRDNPDRWGGEPLGKSKDAQLPPLDEAKWFEPEWGEIITAARIRCFGKRDVLHELADEVLQRRRQLLAALSVGKGQDEPSGRPAAR